MDIIGARGFFISGEDQVQVFDQCEDLGGDGGGKVELFHIFVVLFSGAKIRVQSVNY